MAAPDTCSTANMTGIWVLNRELSEDIDPTFAIQGVPWLVRKVLAYAGVTLTIKHMTIPSEDDPESSVTCIRVKQTVSPGGFGNEDDYILDSKTREATVPIFGTIAMYANYTPVDEIQDVDYRVRLKDGNTGVNVIQENASNALAGWSAVGTWGFEMIDGKRYFARTTITKKDEAEVSVRLVYDYREE